MQDLSSLLKPDPVGALTPTSQAGGHVPSSNEYAQTAPGSEPVGDHRTFEVVPVELIPPQIKQTGGNIPTGTDGMPQAKGEDWSPPGAPVWKNTH